MVACCSSSLLLRVVFLFMPKFSITVIHVKGFLTWGEEICENLENLQKYHYQWLISQLQTGKTKTNAW